MKKYGFSLAELLITLAVTATFLIVMMPSLVKLVPDKNKTKILNAHALIATAVDNVVHDDSLYDCDNVLDGELEALACIASSGNGKFENFISDKLGLVENSGNHDFPWKASNGALWGFDEIGSNNSTYHIITIDLNGTKGPNDVFSTKEEHPDRFKFKVSNYGSVTPNDALTEAYLRNALNTSSRGEDITLARKLLSTQSYK